MYYFWGFIVRIWQYLVKIQLFEHLDSEYANKITKYFSGTWSLINISNDFWYKIKINGFDPYNVVIAKYTHATCDWFCCPGSHMCPQQLIYQC